MNTQFMTRLNSRRLTLARLSWWVIAILGLVYAAAALAYNFENPVILFSESTIRLLNQIGMLDFYYSYYNVIEFVTTFLFLVIGCLIFWRRSDDWLAISTSMMLIASGLVVFGTGLELAIAQPAWRIPFVLFFVIACAGVEILLLAFPDGRFIPSWGRWAVVLVAIYTLFRAIVMTVEPNLGIGGPSFYAQMALFVISLPSQIYRYRRVSSPAQRQQAKWVIFGLIVMIFVTSGSPVFNGKSRKDVLTSE